MSGITTFDRIATGFRVVRGRYYLTITYSNSETGESSHETSKRWFSTESAATEAANLLALQLQAKIRAGQ